MEQKTKEFYERLREKLVENMNFPSVYLYKFIVPSDPQKAILLREVFKETDAEILSKESSSGKYWSFSIKMTARSVEQIIDLYQKAGEIEGIVSL